MKTLTHRLLIAAATLAAIVTTQPAHAVATVAVGTCHASTPSYPTIQQAVDAVASGGTVLVCPGGYPEQITISQPMTLKGLVLGTQQTASISTPGTGLVSNYSDNLFDSLSAHVLIQNAGIVTLTNLDIEGTGLPCLASTREVGVASINSDVIITNSAIRSISTPYTTCDGYAISTGTAAGGNLTVQNSTVNVFATGILMYGGNTATITGNSVTDGLSVNYISPSLSSVAPHILVQNAGTVTISNVDVEGLGANCDTHYAEVGILSSNSNTTVTSSVVRHMSTSDFPCYGVGIYAELAGNLFVQNSTVQGFDYGVETIDANATTLSGNPFGDGANAINITNPAGISTISANTLEGIGCHTGCDGTSGQGIALLNALPGSKVLTNQISVTQKSQTALLLIGNATVTGNKISGVV